MNNNQPTDLAGTVRESRTISVTIKATCGRGQRDVFDDARNVTNTTAVQDAAITTGASATGTIQNDDTTALIVHHRACHHRDR